MTTPFNSWTGLTALVGGGSIQIGPADAASPTAQVYTAQSVVAGTSNTAGANWTFNASKGTGNAVGGNFVFQTAFAGGSGSSQNTLAPVLTLAGTAGTTALGPVQIGGGGASVAQMTFTPNSGSSMSIGMANGGTILDFFGGSQQVFGIDSSGPILVSGGLVRWSNNSANVNTTNDLALSRVSSNQLGVSAGSNGQLTGLYSLTEQLTLNTGATTTNSVNQIPANAILLAASVRVTTTITTATSFTVTGTSSSTTFNTASVAVAAGSTDPGTKAGAFYNATAQTVTITTNVNPGAGVVRITLHYILITPATS